MTGFIVIALDIFNNTIYISNTSPILWTRNINEAKSFDEYIVAKHELEDNFISLANTIKYTNISCIFIIELRNGNEVGREKFL